MYKQAQVINCHIKAFIFTRAANVLIIINKVILFLILIVILFARFIQYTK